jgi:hypothetical protein
MVCTYKLVIDVISVSITKTRLAKKKAEEAMIHNGLYLEVNLVMGLALIMRNGRKNLIEIRLEISNLHVRCSFEKTF